MIKAVIFDLDGTLLNRDESLAGFIDQQYERLNKSLNHIPKDAYTERFTELDNRGYTWKDKVYQQLVDEFAITGLTWEDLLHDYVTQFQYSCVPFPNLANTLEELKEKGLLLGMITNGRGQFQMDNIKALGIETHFDAILISEWEGMKKPDPKIFKKASDMLNVLPEECLFVGDHPEKDVEGAQYAGMKGVWKKGSQWSQANADYTVNDLSELLSIVLEK